MLEKFTKQIKDNFSLLVFSFAIALLPAFSFGKITTGKIIEIRAEDALLFVFGIFWIISFLISKKTKIKIPPLFYIILTLSSVGFLSVLINLALKNIYPDWAFFYFLKEIEIFFLFFYFIYRIKNLEQAKFLVKTWLFLAFINFLYILHQIKTGTQAGEYGTAALSESGVFPTGAFFLLLFVFLFSVFLHYFYNLNMSPFKKIIIACFVVLPILGVFGSGYKTNFLGLFFALFIMIFLSILKKKNLKFFLFSLLALVLVLFILVYAANKINYAYRVFHAFSSQEIVRSFEAGRLGVIMENVNDFLMKLNPLSFLLGLGVGSVGETHNQFLRNFVETGLLGSIIFLFLIFTILKTSFLEFFRNKDNFTSGLCLGLFSATMAMLFFSIVTEPFLTVKPSEIYWIFCAITMACISLEKKYEKI